MTDAITKETTSPWRERLVSPLTWHYAGLAVLLVLIIGLGIRFGLDWAATSERSADALLTKQVELKALDVENGPLRGLDKRVNVTTGQIKNFYAKRVPANYSSILTEIGDLQVKSGVRMSRVQYAQGPPGSDLTEIIMDAGITGEYSQIMHFVNSLERDKTFFIIRAMTFTGQQGGLVNLRLRLSTWLRPADAAASGLPPIGSIEANAAGSESSGKESDQQ
jgi:type IV pilus assembly protein PilO